MLQKLCSYSVLSYVAPMISPCEGSDSWFWFTFMFTWKHKAW